MASEPFSIEIDSFDGGLSPAPYTGQPNQYAYASGLDQWTEPKSLTGNYDFTQYQWGPGSVTDGVSNSSYWGMYLAYDTFTDSDAEIYVVYADAQDDDLQFGNINTSASYAGSLKNARELDSSVETYSDRYDQKISIKYYLGSILVGSSSADEVSQAPELFTNSSTYTYIDNSYGNTSITLKSEFAYLLMTPSAGASASSPAYVARYDFSNGSYLTSSGPAILKPAIELDVLWSGVDMEVYGDYIAIAAVLGQGTRYSQYVEAAASRLYIWDAFSNGFDSRVEINGAAITAMKAHNGNLYLFGATRGGVDIYRYAGGNVTNKIAFIPVNDGTVIDSSDANRAYVRKESISSKGDFIYFGTTLDDYAAQSAKLYSLNTRNGAVDMVFDPPVTNSSIRVRTMHACYVGPGLSLVSWQTTSSPSSMGYVGYSYIKNQETNSGGRGRSADFTVTTSNFFAPIGKKMKVNRALVRHSHLPTANSLVVTLNRNHEELARGIPTTSMMTATGADANTPGVGTSSFYEHIYSFAQADGQPVPLLDAFQLNITVTNASGTSDKPRVFLPIVVEGEYIDSPN